MYDLQRCYKLLEKISFNRVAGSIEETKAREILKDEIKKIGLRTYEEEFPIDYSEIKVAKLEVLSPYKKEYEVTGIKMTGCTSIEGIEAPLIYIENADETNLIDIEGKIVLLNGRVYNKIYKKIIEKKPAGFIALSGSIYDKKDDSDLGLMSIREADYSLGKIPGVCLRELDGQELVELGAEKVKLTLIQEESKIMSHNLITEIEGTTKKDEIIAFTAHYDSVPFSSGAYDNASGSVGIMELLHHFHENRPARTLRFIWCGAEELGLLGSKAYCMKHEEELNKFLFVLNIDMIGVTLGKEIACCTSETSLPSYINYLGKEIGVAISAKQGVYSSDSTPFADKGIPSVSFARISPSGGAEIHSRKDIISPLSPKAFDSSLKTITTFADRIVNSVCFPIERIIPNNMKEELDYYLLRKERLDKN